MKKYFTSNWKGWQYIFWACSQSVLIIIIGDYFAKWTEAFPISNQEAKMVVDVLVCKLILSHIVKCLVSSIPIRSTILKLTYCRRCAIVLASRRPECHHKGHDQMEWWKGINRMLNNQLAMYLPDHQQEIWDGQYPVQRKIKDFIEWKYMYNGNKHRSFRPIDNTQQRPSTEKIQVKAMENLSTKSLKVCHRGMSWLITSHWK